MRSWKIHLTIESRALGVSANYIRSITQQILMHAENDIVPESICELHILLTNDEKMRELNLEFRDKNKTTDVLSFPQFEKNELNGSSMPQDSLNSYLGDLVISTETTLLQAKKFKVSKEQELLRLLVHGILHLCGYDHENVPTAEAQRMRRKESKIRKLVSI
jgi:rRNA maturation RNase YbeY